MILHPRVCFSAMPKKKEAKGTKITPKQAKAAVRMTLEGQRRLTLSHMGIIVFPKCLLKMTNVDEMDLSRNQIQKLPPNFGDLSALKSLDLRGNMLEDLPESIGKLAQLTYLDLSYNRLTSAGIPPTLGSLTNLISLNLGMNKLDALPPTMQALENLEDLLIFDNLFTEEPAFLTALGNLCIVNVMRNPFSEPKEESEEQEPGEQLCLVHESILCKRCLKRCKDKMQSLPRIAKGYSMIDSKKIRTYLGLMVPNSVAKVNQDEWRVRQSEEE